MSSSSLFPHITLITGGGDAEMVEMSIRYLSVLRFLYRDPDTTIFWAPVDLNLYRDYMKFVKEPMDLGEYTQPYLPSPHSLYLKSTIIPPLINASL